MPRVMTLIRAVWLGALGALLLAACTEAPAPDPVEAAPTKPADAVTVLVADLRSDDLAAYARHAVPPDLHARLDAAWREGRTRWPLTELPLDAQMPAMLAALSAPDAEKTLMASYNRQFAGARRELAASASALGLFAAQYIANEPEYSESERDHLVQLVQAVSGWGQQAPLHDAKRARPALRQLIAGARLSGLDSPEAFAAAGMDDGLARFARFSARLKRVMAEYGLDLDAALDSVQATLVDQTGDTARVRVRYRLAGRDIDAILPVERHGDAWYLSDLLRHARLEAGLPATPADGPAGAPVEGESVAPPAD